MDFELEKCHCHPEFIYESAISHCNGNIRKEQNDEQTGSTFCILSLLPKGEFKGELRRVYVLGLFVPDDAPSLLDSVLQLR